MAKKGMKFKEIVKTAFLEEIKASEQKIIQGRDEIRKLISVYKEVVDNADEGIELIENGIDKISETL